MYHRLYKTKIVNEFNLYKIESLRDLHFYIIGCRKKVLDKIISVLVTLVTNS